MIFNTKSSLDEQKTNIDEVSWLGAKIDGINNVTKVKLPNNEDLGVGNNNKIFSRFIQKIKAIFLNVLSDSKLNIQIKEHKNVVTKNEFPMPMNTDHIDKLSSNKQSLER